MVMNGFLFDPLYRFAQALFVALGYRDPATRLHSERVRDLSLELGRRCALAQQELDVLRIGASFHDIGKLGIGDHILMKTSRLEPAEREVMRRHSEIGADIMASIDLDGSQQAALVIRHHHEHFDGRGYPDALAGEAIPICSRIIGITDSYDAMAVRRSYHSGFGHADIMAILKQETGRKHDPYLMRLFCEIVETSESRVARH